MLEMGKSLSVLMRHLNSFNCSLLEMNPRGPLLFKTLLTVTTEKL